MNANRLSKLDRKIISLASKDIPLSGTPFKEMTSAVGIEQRELLARLKSYKKNGVMRKFSAAINHRKIGFKHNAMVVWNIPLKFVEKAGRAMASFPGVSHCYQRKKNAQWNYNLYSMLHGKSKKECLEMVRDISQRVDCKDYRILFSSKEYKKSGVEY